MGIFEETLAEIHKPDTEAQTAAQLHWNSIRHPLHSLGKLEDVVIQIAGIQQTPEVHVDKKALIVMCADNGIVEEGVTQSDQEVTAQVSENFLSEKATAAILCRKAGADIFPIDIGIYRDTAVRNCKIAYGTKNFAKEPAMTKEEAIRAIEVGISLVREKKEDGYQILATGEMGIGNTTTSSAIASVLLDRPVEEMTGRGAGLSSDGLHRKITVIQNAVDRYQLRADDPLNVLAKVGGLDIAGLTGIFLGGAAYRIPIVVDGFISAVAALLAVRICPAAEPYIISSHVSKEPAGASILDALHKSPLLTCDMCLGEGTGAVMLFPLLDMALEVYHNMTTFEADHSEAYVELK